MTRVCVNGVHLNVESRGQGPALLSLHGFTGSLRSWDGLSRALADRFTVVAVDLLGHGLSDSPLDPQRYAAEHAVRDLVSLLQALGQPRAHVLGYSMGGRAALQLALEHPEIVRSIILESASPGIEAASERDERVRGDHALAELIEREGVEAFVDRWERVPLFASQSSLPPAVQLAQREARLRSTAAGLAGSLRGLGAGAQPALYDRLGGLRMPVLLIAGALDEKYSRLAARMASAVPSARVVVVAGAGHNVHLERPEEFNRLVADFISGQEE